MEKATLLPGILADRQRVNLAYLMDLKSGNLLQNHYMEAGLTWLWQKPTDCHWGWESPNSTIRGHFLGHWLSAAAKLHKYSGDCVIKAKADSIVAELARCQQSNGGEWAGPIPAKYLDWALGGRNVGVPHYNLHKTLMGLWDMYEFAGNAQALDVLVKWADWFKRWTDGLTREQMDVLLDVETGGMMEVWANLHGATGRQEHLTLMERYERRRLFDRLLSGEDPLTNMHANTTVPEALGAARAYEVTGDERWRRIVEAYWKCAVTDRGHYCTGSMNSGEVWCPPGRELARLGDKTQEHCVAYNMVRLADKLFQWTGEARFADYIERSIWNGILAQQHPRTGMPDYYLATNPGAVKAWGTPTEDFWCCHGSVVQAHSSNVEYILHTDEDGLVVSQYFAVDGVFDHNGARVSVTLNLDGMGGDTQGLGNAYAGPSAHPRKLRAIIRVKAERPVDFTLKLRMPWWIGGVPSLALNGRTVMVPGTPSTFHGLSRTWYDDTLVLELPYGITAVPLADAPHMAALMDGPVVLAGICDGETTLYGCMGEAEGMLRPCDERHWGSWRHSYMTVGQPVNIRFMPLYEVVDERYTVYFPFAPRR